MIVNWNGVAWLRKCIPSIISAGEKVGADVIVVDNDSADESAEFIESTFPQVQFWHMGYNKVLAAYNDAAVRSQHEILVLLNNDLVVAPDFIERLLKWFGDDRVFAASSAALSYPPSADSVVEFGAQRIVWSFGSQRNAPRHLSRACGTSFNSGGWMACRRDRFLQLGGFDELFFPGYVEDQDLGYRAWKMGWICIYDPASIVYHAGGSTMGRNEKILRLWAQNDFLFQWKNLDPSNLLWHLFLCLSSFATRCYGDERTCCGGSGRR